MALALPEISEPRCTGCGSCIEACHVMALGFVASRAVLCDADRCDYCTACELVCPVGAIACPYEVIIEDWS